MSTSAPSQIQSWLPVTFRGVAALSQAPASRQLVVQFAVALLSAASMVWFLATAVGPALQETFRAVPDGVQIREGHLVWTGASPAILGRSPFLAILVDLDGSNASGHLADVQCEFERSSLKLRSLFGYLNVPYPIDWEFTANGLEEEAWWGAWRPVVWSATGLGLVLGLLLTWRLLGAVYSIPVRLLAFMLDRHASWFQCWSLAEAAQLPGALWMTAAIVLYGLRQLELIGLLVAFGLHLVISVLYLVLAPGFLPSLTAGTGSNPFAAPPPKDKAEPKE
jgi:hypothetical protein